MAMNKRYIVLVLSTLENFFHSAIMFGWPSIVYVFKDMGYYSHLCPTNSSESNSTTKSSPLITQLVTLPDTTDEVDDSPVTCDEQDASLLLVYTIASSLLPCSMILGGILFEKAGTLVARLTFSISLLLSYLCIAASSPEMPNLLYPGTTIMAMAGILVYITSIEVGNLIPASKSTVIGMMTGCSDASAFVPLLIKIAYDFGVPLNVSFYVLAGSTALFLINTILLPRKHIPWPLPENYELEGCCSPSLEVDSSLEVSLASKDGHDEKPSDKYPASKGPGDYGLTIEGCQDQTTYNYDNPGFEYDENSEDCAPDSKVKQPDEIVDYQPADSSDDVAIRTRKPSGSVEECKTAEAENIQNSESFLAALDKLAEEKRLEDFPTIWVALKSPMFILMSLWTMFIQGFIMFVIGIMNSWLTWLADGDMEAVSYYTNVYSLIAFASIVGTPLMGSFIDRKRHRLGKLNSSSLEVSERGPYTEFRESWLPVCLSCITAIIMAGLMLIPILPVQYATFGLFVVVRSMFFATSAAIVPITFPMHFYPTIFGLANCIAGIVSFIQFPLFILIQNVLDNDPRWVIAGFLIAIAAMLVLPAYIYIHGRNREKMYLRSITNMELGKQSEGDSVGNQKKAYDIQASNL